MTQKVEVISDSSSSNGILIAYLKDVKPNNTVGGGAASGGWINRDLNTLSGDTSFISLDSGTGMFTINSGTYDVEGEAPGLIVGSHKIKLLNVTDTTDDIIGSSAIANNADTTGTTSVFRDRLVLATTKTFRIQHRVTVTNATNGQGIACNFGVDEVYTQVKVTKIS